MAKMFEDALRAFGILEEDDPKYVARSIIEVVVVPRPKGSKATNAQGKKADAEDQDWLELSITSIV